MTDYFELRRTLEREALIAADTNGRETVNPTLVLDLLAQTRGLREALEAVQSECLLTGRELHQDLCADAGPNSPRSPYSGREQIAADALRLWGEDAQLAMMVEECAEFIQAVMHYRRGRVDAAHVAQEIADVRLMMDQAAWLFGPDLCQQAESAKRARLFARLERAEAARADGPRVAAQVAGEGSREANHD